MVYQLELHGFKVKGKPKDFKKITKKPYLTILKILFSAKLVDLQVRVGILPLIGLITSIV